MLQINRKGHCLIFLSHQILVEPPAPWVEKVIKDEQVHLFYSSGQARILEPRRPEDIALDIERLNVDTTLMPDTGLRIFEPPQGMCLESPLERFLTPGGCSAPSYFVGPAMKQMGFRLGNMDEKYGRKAMAQQDVALVIRNSRQAVTRRSPPR